MEEEEGEGSVRRKNWKGLGMRLANYLRASAEIFLLSK